MKKLFIITSSILSTFSSVTLSSCCSQSSDIAVTLYAGDIGTFGQSKTLFLTNVNAGTALKNIANYAEPESDYEFLGWVDDSGKEIKPDTVINSSIFLRANYSIPAPNDFETDPWSTVTYYANQGLDALCTAYNCEPSYFLGKKRLLKLNNLDHQVMVVGTNNERYEKDGTSQIAALTFQFYTCVSAKEKNGLEIKYDVRDELSSFDYWSSTLWNALNGTNVNWTDVTVKKSVVEMVEEGEPLVYHNIKDVYRGVNSKEEVTPDYRRWYLDTRRTKFFEPTMGNYFSDKGIRDTGYGEELTNVFKTQEAMQRCMEEGEQYQYFALPQNIGDHIITTWEPPLYYQCLARVTVNEAVTLPYHLSSPFIDEKNQSWYIEGYSPHSNFIEMQYYVAPCFCI